MPTAAIRGEMLDLWPHDCEGAEWSEGVRIVDNRVTVDGFTVLNSGLVRQMRRGAPNWPSGYYHLIVATCVQREDGTVLLTQRAATKAFAFGWEFPGGSALAGETSRSASSRELLEETGISVSPSTLTLIGRFTEQSALLDFYHAPAPSNLELRLHRDEVAAADWVTLKEVEHRLKSGLMATPWVPRLEALWPQTLRALGTGT